LPSVEETLRILAGALRAATASGLEKVEVQRLQVISTLSRTCKELLVDYLDYRAREKDVAKELYRLDAGFWFTVGAHFVVFVGF
jgi:hypothetical protein